MKTKFPLVLLLALSGLVANAQTMFQKIYKLNDAVSDEVLYSVQQTTDGGYITSGYINKDTWRLIKTTASGDTLFTRTFGAGSKALAGTAFCVRQTSDGGYVIGGGFEIASLIKLNASGNFVWGKQFDDAALVSGYSQVHTVEQTADGGFILSATAGTQIRLIKTNSTGDTTWTKSEINATPSTPVVGLAFEIPGGNYIWAGGQPNKKFWIAQLDAAGNSTWVKEYPEVVLSGNNYYGDKRLLQTSDGGYIFIADYSSNKIVKIAFWGTVEWAKVYGAAAGVSLNSIYQTTDGRFVAVGKDSAGLCLIKMDGVGSVLWSKRYVNQKGSEAWSVKQTTDKGFIVAGNYKGTDNLNYSYLIKTDSLGNSTGCATANQNYWVSNASVTVGTPSLDIKKTPALLFSSFNSGNITIASGNTKVANPCGPTGIMDAGDVLNKSKIYPNPFSTSAFLKTGVECKNASLIIYNFTGQQVKNVNNISGDEIKIDRDNLPVGIYFIILTQNNTTIATEKIIITD